MPDEQRSPSGRELLAQLAAFTPPDARTHCGWDEQGKHRPSQRIRGNVASCDGCGELIEYDQGEERWVLLGGES